jgi:hypothetical protein
MLADVAGGAIALDALTFVLAVAAVIGARFIWPALAPKKEHSTFAQRPPMADDVATLRGASSRQDAVGVRTSTSMSSDGR